MAMLDIVLYPDDPLTQKAEPFDEIGNDVSALAANMFETMAAYDGVGLAGPQVGVAKRIACIKEPDRPGLCLVNPEILEFHGAEQGEEGCLSLPYVYANVSRATHLRVRALSETGKALEFDAEGLLARIIQHETDHLDGIVFPDRLDVLSREAKMQEWADVRRRLTAAVNKM